MISAFCPCSAEEVLAGRGFRYCRHRHDFGHIAGREMGVDRSLIACSASLSLWLPVESRRGAAGSVSSPQAHFHQKHACRRGTCEQIPLQEFTSAWALPKTEGTTWTPPLVYVIAIHVQLLSILIHSKIPHWLSFFILPSQWQVVAPSPGLTPSNSTQLYLPSDRHFQEPTPLSRTSNHCRGDDTTSLDCWSPSMVYRNSRRMSRR